MTRKEDELKKLQDHLRLEIIPVVEWLGRVEADEGWKLLQGRYAASLESARRRLALLLETRSILDPDIQAKVLRLQGEIDALQTVCRLPDTITAEGRRAQESAERLERVIDRQTTSWQT